MSNWKKERERERGHRGLQGSKPRELKKSKSDANKLSYWIMIPGPAVWCFQLRVGTWGSQVLRMPTKGSEAWPQTIPSEKCLQPCWWPPSSKAMMYPEDGHSLDVHQSPGVGREPAEDRWQCPVFKISPTWVKCDKNCCFHSAYCVSFSLNVILLPVHLIILLTRVTELASWGFFFFF